MQNQHDTRPVAVALEHMTGPSRGAVTWLSASTLDVTLDAGFLLHIAEAEPGTTPDNLVARLHRIEDTYELEAPDGVNVWVNGDRVTLARLQHGDTVEFGETGPLCRARFYTEHSELRNSVPDILSDILKYMRVSRQPLAPRLFRAARALIGRLSQETSLLFRVSVLIALAGLGLVTYQQHLLNTQLQQRIERAASRLDTVSAAVVNARREALQPTDLADLRESLEQRVTANVSRLEELEQRSTAVGRVIAESGDSVAFILGSYIYREAGGGRVLRHIVNAEGMPLMSPRGRPLLSLDGNGPDAEVQFTGTGFFAGGNGALITNRHVALPWEQNAGMPDPAQDGLEPVMKEFRAYVPGAPELIPVRLLRASEASDLAILQPGETAHLPVGLRLSAARPRPGDEVIVMGYPTGLRSMLAQAGASFIAALQDSGTIGFWDIAARLSEAHYIAPLASRGIVGQVTEASIIYDAETTHGGSGGPVLDVRGEVVAVNAAILPDFGGSNIGVPVTAVRALLTEAGMN